MGERGRELGETGRELGGSAKRQPASEAPIWFRAGASLYFKFSVRF